MYAWNWEPLLLLGLAVQLTAYLLCTVGPLRRFFPSAGPASPLEVQLFCLGWLCLFVALVSPIDTLAGVSLTMHMTQHLLLVLFAPPLMLLGTPEWLFRPIMRLPVVPQIAMTLTRFIPALLIFNVVFIVWHVPANYELTLRDQRFHILEHALFFGTAVLTWWPIFGSLPELPRTHPLSQTVYLFLQSLPATILGALITFSNDVLYPHYLTQPRLWGLSVMDDQQLGGLIMWIPGSLVYFAVLTFVFIRWLNREDRPQPRPKPRPSEANIQ